MQGRKNSSYAGCGEDAVKRTDGALEVTDKLAVARWSDQV